MLGCFLNFSIMLLIGSFKIASLLKCSSRSTANLLTDLLKSLLNNSARAMLSVTISLPSKRLILLVYVCCFIREKCLTCFQNFFIIGYEVGIKIFIETFSLRR